MTVSPEAWAGLATLSTAVETLERIVSSTDVHMDRPLQVMGQDALLFAASMYDEDLALEVLAARARIPVDVNAIDNHGYTALHYAVDADMHALAQTLLATEAICVRLQTEDLSVVGHIQSGGRTPLHLAVLRGSIDLMQLLLEADPSLGTVADLDGHLPVHLAQLHGGSMDLIGCLQACHAATLYDVASLPERKLATQAIAAARYQASLSVPDAVATPHIFPRIWTQAECERVLGQLEATTRVTGWHTTRHTSYPTTDLPSYCLPLGEHYWVQDTLSARLFPLILSRFQLPASTQLSFRDLFYVKYEAAQDAQRDLALHCDGSVLSFNVLLNQRTDFVGGGTFFAPTQTTVHIEQGDVVVHSGRVVHGAAPVTEGKRLILVAFLNVRPPACAP